MICPDCSSPHSSVLETRKGNSHDRRRRECLSCNHRWTTAEITAEDLAKYTKAEEALQNILNKLENFL